MRAWALGAASAATLLHTATAFTAPGMLPASLPTHCGAQLGRGAAILPVARIVRRQGFTVPCKMSGGAALSTEGDNKALPAYHKLAKIKIAGLDANVVVGLLFVTATFGVALLLYPAILLSAGLSHFFDPKRRRAIDWIVHWWAKITCLFILHSPKVTGLENLPPDSEAVMYIPNHCSYLDIFTMSGFLPRPFKYVSKIEILRIPLIGWAMQFAGHIAIKRMDKRSQLQTFKDTVECLINGNSIVTFAEGTRSKTGKLMPFKKGPIKMALKAKKKIVPVSICNLYRWMPDTACTPLAFPRNVEIKVHPPVETVGRNEDEILADVFNAVNAGLPDYQKTQLEDIKAMAE
eukprot:CAMPEP_0206242576 /NCGR_PEP_ID=MMETSP0047_2-20121206/17135_1 /ASSEMBLY_ACC=CAM_ASM_000192 /TAXON_ID=195065 /ORGANISM="Chroomonas mesostigmatica_cf, Strain CCMP1168" /LENGTH=347 /DNA_ID=CAMNT_0053667613 /DNA_START=30 /DNA_END=1073 /DNA_ORIENTATION=-